MKKLILLILAAVSCYTQAQDHQKFNLGFEKQSVEEELPDGWHSWGSYDLSADTISYSGERSGKITSVDDGSTFGSIAFRIPARYSGNSIQLEGYMKIKDVENGFAGLLLRIDQQGSTIEFDNMQSQNIHGTRDWQKYTITLEYPEEADDIYVAGLLVGQGEAWFDEFVLTIDGKDVQTLKESAPKVYNAQLDKEFDDGSGISIEELSPELIANLSLLGKIWGFLKYHHPEIAKGDVNWDYELFRFLPKYLEAKNASDKDAALINWIEGIGELPECDSFDPTPDDAFLKPDHSWISDSKISETLKDKLHSIYINRNQGKHFYISIVPNIGNPTFKNENNYPEMSYPDDGFRLLALYRYWTIINYFFPYRHLIDKDWNIVLNEYIPKFLNASSELEYEFASIELIGDIHDTHANLWGGADKIAEWKGTNYAPVHIRFIENQPVVTDYYNPELKEVTELEIGDVITTIGGKDIQSILSEISRYYPASNQPTRLRDIAADLLRSNDSIIDITYERGKQQFRKSLQLFPKDSLNIYRWYRRDDEKCFRLLDNNIGYITLKSIKDQDVAKIKEEFKDTKGIILDIRNYPSTFVPFSLGTWFVSTTTPFAKFTKGNINNPGEFTFIGPVELTPTGDSYKGKLIVLLNELSQSQAEYTSMAFRAGENTTVLGSTTAAADGNISAIQLPGGMRTMVSGIGVYYPDGKETQRIGIVPDIEVHPTIEGIRNGRDELLEKAVQLILSD